MGRLDGRVALITGAAGGIGQATAHRLSADGAAVVVTGNTLPRIEALAAAIEAAGGTALALELDVASEAAWEAAIGTTVAELGRLDILHNNAAWTAAVTEDGAPADIDVELWDRVMAVNLRGTALGCKHGVRAMLEAGGGSIVNMTSDAALRGNTLLTAYGASKAGVSYLTQGVAVTYGKHGIRCNAISPGFVRTSAMERFVPPEQHAFLESVLPAPRLGRPEDIAGMVAFLASDEAEWITGQEICVDGGQLCYLPHLSPFGATAVGPGG